MSPKQNRDTTLKTVLVLILVGAVFFILYKIIPGGGDSLLLIGYNRNSDINVLITTILVVVVKLLWLVFIVSMIVGLFLVIKRYLLNDRKNLPQFTGKPAEGYACPYCGTRLTAEFKFCPNCKASLKDKCLRCGSDLQVGWKCCPICGTEKTRP